MAVGLIILGIALLAVGIKGTQNELAALLADDFTGEGNFWFFIAGLFFLGALGYFQPLRNTSRLLIALTLLVFILANGGFWTNLVAAIKNPGAGIKAAETPVPEPASVAETGANLIPVKAGADIVAAASGVVANAVSNTNVNANQSEGSSDHSSSDSNANSSSMTSARSVDTKGNAIVGNAVNGIIGGVTSSLFPLTDAFAGSPFGFVTNTVKSVVTDAQSGKTPSLAAGTAQSIVSKTIGGLFG